MADNRKKRKQLYVSHNTDGSMTVAITDGAEKRLVTMHSIRAFAIAMRNLKDRGPGYDWGTWTDEPISTTGDENEKI